MSCCVSEFCVFKLVCLCVLCLWIVMSMSSYTLELLCLWIVMSMSSLVNEMYYCLILGQFSFKRNIKTPTFHSLTSSDFYLPCIRCKNHAKLCIKIWQNSEILKRLFRFIDFESLPVNKLQSVTFCTIILLSFLFFSHPVKTGRKTTSKKQYIR